MVNGEILLYPTFGFSLERRKRKRKLLRSQKFQGLAFSADSLLISLLFESHDILFVVRFVWCRSCIVSAAVFFRRGDVA